MGDSCLKACLHFSVEAAVFIRRERGTEQREKWRGLQSSLRADEHSHSNKAASGPVCVILVQSPWPHVILAPWMKVRKSPGAGMSEIWSLYLLKFLGFYTSMLFIYSYILFRVSTYRNNVKRMVGRVTISRRYNFPTVAAREANTLPHRCLFLYFPPGE